MIRPPERLTLVMTLHGEDVEIDVAVLPPDPGVGRRGYGFEDAVIRDSQGAVCPWQLTAAERERIIDKIQELV